jgi:hypothetical protein
MKQHHRGKLDRTIVASAIPESEIVKRFDTPVYRIHSKPFDIQRLVGDIKDCARKQGGE